VINRFGGDGIELAVSGGNLITGDYLGTDLTGNLDRGNHGCGLLINGVTNNAVGGTAVGARNVISGNDVAGVMLVGRARSNSLLGNYIGTNAAGNAALGNFSGVVISNAANNVIGGTTAAARNIISGNTFGSGVQLLGAGATGNRVQGNYIGTNAAGTVAVANSWGVDIRDGASNNTVGGTVAGAGNILSGNLGDGVLVIAGATGNQLQGNSIGTDSSGNVALANANDGVCIYSATNNLIGGTTTSAANVISGNRGDGVEITGGATGNKVQGNFIGSRRDGASPLPNGWHGIRVTGLASRNLIGGTLVDKGLGNTIAFNLGDGVFVESGTGNTILSNSIHSNAGLGIRLGPGANRRQSAPVLDRAASDVHTIWGKVFGTPGATLTIQFFASTAPDASGYGEGERWLGSLSVTIGASGVAYINFGFPYWPQFSAGEWISATATDSAGDTSEFSGCVRAASVI
jgi:parallel beta-helix repeat protein